MAEAPETTREVGERHRFDVSALHQWLDDELEGVADALTVRQFKGGQSNPTFWISDGKNEYVLRKKPPGDLLPSAHAVEREYRVLAALQHSDVPVARVYGLCEDASVIGTPFYMMEHVRGRIFWNVQLPELSPRKRTAVYEETARVLAAIHSVDVTAVGLADFGRQGRYMTRQIERWTQQYRASQTGSVDPMERLIAWLPTHVPKSDETLLTHGDFRLDNLIFHPTEARVLAVIDWELSTLGHPLCDLAYNCMLYHIAMPRVGGLLGVDFKATGIPTEPEFVKMYCDRMSRRGVEEWATFKAFSLFRLAAIAQGVYKRSQQGNASSDDGAMYGAAVQQLADVACKLVKI